MLSETTKFAFSALVSHATRGSLILLECRDGDDKPVPVLCVVNGEGTIIPVAQMLPPGADPYKLFTAPTDQYHNYNMIDVVEPVPDVTN